MTNPYTIHETTKTSYGVVTGKGYTHPVYEVRYHDRLVLSTSDKAKAEAIVAKGARLAG